MARYLTGTLQGFPLCNTNAFVGGHLALPGHSLGARQVGCLPLLGQHTDVALEGLSQVVVSPLGSGGRIPGCSKPQEQVCGQLLLGGRLSA